MKQKVKKQKTKIKMPDLNPTITLNVNGLKISIKRQRLAEQI